MMHCPYCDAVILRKNYCESCGNDVKQFKRLYRLSAICYNEGLKKAAARNLSGAVTDLKNSLKINKKNTDARNLLGLVYSEMGEMVSALREWVISKHFKEEDNEAEYYLSFFQSNPTRLNNSAQLIKKYNSALRSAKKGNNDLAIIQLKKIVSISPHYIRALLLLGLIYLKSGRKNHAKKYLNMVLSVDICNPSALVYLRELDKENAVTEEKEITPKSDEIVFFADSDSFAPANAYREDRPNIFLWINLVLGIIIGIAFFMIAVLPGIRAQSVENKKAEIVNLNESLAEANASLDRIKSENGELTAKIEELTKKNEELSKSGKNVKNEVDGDYKKLIQAANYFIVGDEKNTADTLVKIKKSDLKDKNLINIYNSLSSKVFAEQSEAAFVEGRDLYNKGSYEEALKKLEAALEMNQDNVDAMYFIGRTYDRQGESDKAKEWYNKIINDYGDTARAAEARQRLRNLGGA